VSTVLTSTGGPVNGATVDWETILPDGTQLLTPSVTDPTGLATATITQPQRGVLTVTASFAGTDSLQPSTSGSAQVSVYQPVQLTMPANGYGAPHDDTPVTATLTTVPGGAPVPDQMVTFSAPGFAPCNATTDANGVASCNVDSVAFTGAATATATFDNPTDFFTDAAGDLPPQPETATTALRISFILAVLSPPAVGPQVVGIPFTATTVLTVPDAGSYYASDQQLNFELVGPDGQVQSSVMVNTDSSGEATASLTPSVRGVDPVTVSL
jgi:hypothetical protein